MAGAGGQEVGRLSVRIVPNTDRFRAELKAQLEAIENSLKAKIPVDLDVDTAAAQAKINSLRAKDVKVNVDVDNNRLQRSFSDIGNNLKNLFTSNGGRGGGIPLGSFADSAALAAVAAAFAAPALALLSGVLVSLPALMSAVAAPAAAIALGLDGIKKSAGVLQGPLDDLKKSVSGVFESKLTPVFEKLGGLLPKLEGPMGAVAEGLSTIAGSFVDTVTSQAGMEKIQGTISNIGKAIGDAAPGIGSFTTGILTLAEKVSAKFPNVSKAFNDIGKSFENWVTKITTAGPDGKTPLDKGLTSLKDTVKEILNLGGDLLKQGFDFLSDPQFGEKMKTFVADIKDLVNNVLPSLGKFFQDLAGAMRETSSFIDKLGLNNSDRNNPDKPKKKGPAPEFGLTTDAPIVQNLGPIIAQVEQKFLLMWSRVKLFAVTAFTELATTIPPLLAGAFSGITNIAATAFNGVVTVATGIVAQVVSQFAQIPARLAGVWASLAGAAAAGFAGVVAAATTAMASCVAAVAAGAAQVVAEIASLPGKIAAAAGGFAGALVAAGKALMDGLLSGIKAGLSAVLSFASSIAAKIAAVKGPLPKDRTTLTPAGQALMQGLQDGIEGGLQGVLSRAGQIGQEIADAINAGTAGADLGGLPDQLKKSLDELELSRKQLKVQKDGLPKENKDGRKSLQDQMDQIGTLKDQLNLQKDQLGFSQKYGDSVDQNTQGTNLMGDSLNKMVDIGKNFAMANANQFMSDLGMSGNGAIPTIANLGLDWASGMLSKAITGQMGGGTQIHVNSVDEAFALKSNIDNRKALQYKTR